MFYLVYVYVPSVEPPLPPRTGVPDGCWQPCAPREHNLGTEQMLLTQNRLLFCSYSLLTPSSPDPTSHGQHPHRLHPHHPVSSPPLRCPLCYPISTLVSSPNWSSTCHSSLLSLVPPHSYTCSHPFFMDLGSELPRVRTPPCSLAAPHPERPFLLFTLVPQSVSRDMRKSKPPTFA